MTAPPALTGKSAVVLRGTLDNVGLFDALRLLASSSKSGVLRLGSPFSALVYLVDGRIGCVRAEGSFSLADALDRNGLLGGTALRATDAADEELLLMAVRDHERLAPVVRAYVLDVLFELVVLSEGEFDFVAGLADPWGGRHLQDAEEVIAEEQRRVDEWKQIAGSIPPMSVAPRLAARLPDNGAGVTVTGEEWRVLALVNGSTSVAGLVASSGMGPLDACRALYQLVSKGLVVSP